MSYLVRAELLNQIALRICNNKSKTRNSYKKLLTNCSEIELLKRYRNGRKSLSVADPIQMVHKLNPTMFDGPPAATAFDCETACRLHDKGCVLFSRLQVQQLNTMNV